jgi:acyl dehydratase
MTQINYEDIAVGSEIPALTKQPTTRQLVMWAGASSDYNEIHYDKDFALSRGLPGIIVQGQLSFSFLGQLLTDWIGDSGSIRKLTCSYKGMNFPGEPLVCKGEVSRKYIENGEHCIACNVWTENIRGEKTITGTAIVIVPSRT